MSVENFKKFGQKCVDDLDVRKKAKEIGFDDLEGIVAYGKELGLDFSVDDMQAMADELGLSADQELSDEDLEKVAGGIFSATACAVAGAVGSVVGGSASVAQAAGAW